VQVIGILKELVGNFGNNEINQAALSAERKAKAEEIKQEQLAFEEKLRNADAVERKRLLDAKAEDDKQIAFLRSQAEARRKISVFQAHSDFPTIESAIEEINRLKVSIAGIESGYETELAQTRKKVIERYTAQLSLLDKTQRDEFETTQEFNDNKSKKRSELNQQRDEEISRLNTSKLAAAEIAPLRDKINELYEREYTTSAETFTVNLGTYNADERQFPVRISSKLKSLKFEMNGNVPLPRIEAKVFKQQWLAGLIRAEIKMKTSGVQTQLGLVNDGDNSRLYFYEGRFMTSQAIEADKLAKSKVVEISPSAGTYSNSILNNGGANVIALVKEFGGDCLACHSVNKKIVGPAWIDVAAKYKGDSETKAMLVEKVIRGGKGNWDNVTGGVSMTPHPSKPSREEIGKIVAAILRL
jgi:cytochrome c